MKFKEIFSLLLCMVIFVISAVGICPTAFAEQSQLDKIIQFAKSKIGSTEYVGMCQAFVYQCYKAGGIDNGSAPSAIAAWGKWGVSTSKTNIPIGACVYFDENVGSSYGHVGIYIGDNKMIHSRQSVGMVVESSMTWYLENCYLGWGWQGGVQPSSNTVQEPSTSQVNDYYVLTAPDGYQTVRAQASSSSANVGTLYTGDVVCVTQYNSDRTWGYINTGTVAGWIRLYYVEPTSPPSNYYLLTAPDGYQTVRSEATTSSASVGTLYTGDIVYVTKYNSDRTWGYINNGVISGWIMLYYVEPTSHSHSYSSWAITKSATCTTTGTQTRKCTGCSTTETQTISAQGHNYSSDWTIDTAATCTQNGSKSRHCTRCGSKTDITQITASGHTSYNYEWLYYPQENSNGEFCKYCGVCKGIIGVYEIPYIIIEKVIFTDNTIQCRILKPNIDTALSYFITAMPSTEQNDEIFVSLSEDEQYNIYTVEDISLLKERQTFNIQIWFGAGEIPYAINILENKQYSFKNILNDINGDSSNDATDLLLLRNKLLSTIEIETGDTNADGQINVKDLVHLKKHIAEM